MRKLFVISVIILTLSLAHQAFAIEPTTESTSSTASLKHIVKAGETLSRIASTYQVSLDKIIELNKITNPNKLQIGQTLFIPSGNNEVSGNTAIKGQAPATNASPETLDKKYIVKPGDTLSRIAGARGLTVESIVTANKISNPHALHIGQVLTLPQAKQNVTLASRSDERSREADNEVENKPEQTASSAQAEKVIDYAKNFLGCAYSYGASGPKRFDCSGFTMHVFKNFNIDLPHQSASQGKKGTQVNKDSLKPGDLVFFKTNGKGISHVGIYIGNGNFIHASTGGRKVEITSLSDTYYQKRYVTARRILN